MMRLLSYLLVVVNHILPLVIWFLFCGGAVFVFPAVVAFALNVAFALMVMLEALSSEVFVDRSDFLSEVGGIFVATLPWALFGGVSMLLSYLLRKHKQAPEGDLHPFSDVTFSFIRGFYGVILMNLWLLTLDLFIVENISVSYWILVANAYLFGSYFGLCILAGVVGLGISLYSRLSCLKKTKPPDKPA